MEITLKVESIGIRTTIRLYSERADDGMRFICVVSCDDDEEYQSEIPEEEMQKLLAMASEPTISITGKCPFGLDGTSYRLTVSDGMAQATYAWWEEAEGGWEELGKISTALLHLGTTISKRYLP